MDSSVRNRQYPVFDRLRQGILAGTFARGVRLPATRSLATELGVARQTVVRAYERLAAEGYVQARTGSGTYVATDLPDTAPEPAATAPLRAKDSALPPTQAVASVTVKPPSPRPPAAARCRCSSATTSCVMRSATRPSVTE